jgi:hypothetical protein
MAEATLKEEAVVARTLRTYTWCASNSITSDVSVLLNTRAMRMLPGGEDDAQLVSPDIGDILSSASPDYRRMLWIEPRCHK